MRTRLALIGAGHLGRIHARILSHFESAELAVVVEPDLEARARAQEVYAGPFLDSLEALPRDLHGAIVATPSTSHARIGEWLLRRGLHVFMEKPLASRLIDAQRLQRLAARLGRVLQVGHVERFNPVWETVQPLLDQRLVHIDAQRLVPYSRRGCDVNVVFDLMIHDLDLICSLFRHAQPRVTATGFEFMGPLADFAQARLEYPGGCVVNLTASRVHAEPTRTWRVVTEEGLLAVDFAGHRIQITRPIAQPPKPIAPNSPCGRSHMVKDPAEPNAAPASADCRRHPITASLPLARCSKLGAGEKEVAAPPPNPHLPTETISVPTRNAIEAELQEFVTAIESGGSVTVDGEAGTAAVRLAERITRNLENRQAMSELSLVTHTIPAHRGSSEAPAAESTADPKRRAS